MKNSQSNANIKRLVHHTMRDIPIAMLHINPPVNEYDTNQIVGSVFATCAHSSWSVVNHAILFHQGLLSYSNTIQWWMFHLYRNSSMHHSTGTRKETADVWQFMKKKCKTHAAQLCYWKSSNGCRLWFNQTGHKKERSNHGSIMSICKWKHKVSAGASCTTDFQYKKDMAV